MSNVFEESVLKFADSVSTSTLHPFLRDNMSVPLSVLACLLYFTLFLFFSSCSNSESSRQCLSNQNNAVFFYLRRIAPISLCNELIYINFPLSTSVFLNICSFFSPSVLAFVLI